MPEVEQPIFFIGMPRSGTTIIFEAFAYHPDLAWPSVYTSRWPRWPQVEALRRLLDNRLFSLRGRESQYDRHVPGNRLLPRPTEAYEFWNAHASADFARSYLDEGAGEPGVRTRLPAAVGRLMRWQGRQRFTAKLTGPPRIRFLSDVFPDAIFVHLVRDGRAVVQSLLKVDFWRKKGGLESPFWTGKASDEIAQEWQVAGRDPGMLAALQWRAVVRRARQESAALPKHRFHELRYEDFIAQPIDSMEAIQRACNLDISSQIASHISRNAPRRDLNQKFLKEFTPAYLAQLSALMQPELSLYGYT